MRTAFRSLVAALALGGLQVAHAGYAQLANPSGYAATSGGHTYAANAANDKVFGKVIHQPNGLSTTVAGQPVKMPAAYRLAANAPRVAAQVLFLHPGIRTAVGIAAWLSAAALAYDVGSQVWSKIEKGVKVGGTIYAYSSDGPWFTSAEAALSAYLKTQATSVYRYEAGSCGASSCTYSQYLKSTGVLVNRHTLNLSTRRSEGETSDKYVPVTVQQFVDELAARPMPSTVPLELPAPAPLPVEQPYINPAPGENPANRPLRVPTGEPQPIPNTNPRQWRQPYVDIVPAPTPESPWRVDVKPGEVTSTDPNPVQNPKPDAEEKPTEEQDKSLCEKHPEIAACEKVEVTDKPLPEQPKLYEPKYPDGITGLWNSKLQEIKATPLFNLAPSLLPNVSAGTCPSWKVDLSIDGWTNAGLQDVSPPCWVWDVAKLVIIASALLLARRLIFGG